MPYQGLADGLYLAEQTGLKLKGYPVTHFGIIDVGNVLGIPGVDTDKGPTVIHQTPPEIQFEHIGGERPWEIMDRITDIDGAKARIAQGLEKPKYDIFTNNCEHFAKDVAHDNRVSGQVLVGVGAALGLGILLLKLLKRD